MNKKYQNNYAAGRPQMYDVSGRRRKAKNMVLVLKDYFVGVNLRDLKLLDVGASSGIIDEYLARIFRSVDGIDIDSVAIEYARRNFHRKNLKFKIDDALSLSFKNDSFDVVVCAHVYEHVADKQKLFKEIHRVLRPGGVCYLAAQNRLWPLEAHHNLLFLSWLPKNLANIYIRVRGKKEYYEDPSTYWGLRRLVRKFGINDYTQKILKDPKKFGYANLSVPSPIADITKYFTPTMFWVLKK